MSLFQQKNLTATEKENMREVKFTNLVKSKMELYAKIVNGL